MKSASWPVAKRPAERYQGPTSRSMSYRVRFSSDAAQCLELAQLCRDVDSGTGGDSVLLKDDTPATLQLLETEIGKLVVKRYNTKNAWHSVRRNFQVSRAVNCLKMSEEFTRAGIPVPEPIGVVPAAHRSFFRPVVVCFQVRRRRIADRVSET